MSDVKWNTSEYNESFIQSQVLNLTSNNNSDLKFRVHFNDLFEGAFSEEGNLSDVTIEGDMIIFSFNRSSATFLTGDEDAEGSFTFTGFGAPSSYITIEFTIPSENINSFNPLPENPTYNVEKTY